MLADAHARGVAAALEKFGFDSAAIAQKAKSWGRGLGQVLFGQPGKAFVQGPKAFAPGGMLSHENIWWPSTKGLSGTQKILPWMQRASTLAAPLQMMSSADDDPNEGALSNVLGRAGQIAGSAYGFPSMGALGAPMLARAGSGLGHSVGHLLGSATKEPQR